MKILKITLFWLFIRCSWASQVALVIKNLPASAGDIRDVGSIPESGRAPGGGHSNPLQYFCLENPIPDRSLVRYSQKESACTGAWLPGSFMDQRKGRRWAKDSKKLFNPCKCPLEWQASGRGVFSFTSLQSFTGGWLRVSPWGRPLCMPPITRNLQDES